MTKQITDDLAQALWETLLLHSTKGRLRYGDITAIACEFGLTTKAVTRVWKKGIRSMGDRVAAVVKAGWSRRGRKKRLPHQPASSQAFSRCSRRLGLEPPRISSRSR
ncbi:hypothetical protein PF001_g22215 [Phytophthora fragariae]|uniref:DUF7769 domain-containing protein n=1 Tax=Phytophthora fragariae TaxID=53985 RepID=A0A6A4C7X1_9STRA|nr:hypothetical protein PF001_g22215 [Phytophthora fragariae]